MKKVTFPHMGNLSISVKTFFAEMGIDTVVPPVNSKKTLNLGMKYSPEFACLPLKITIGNFIEAIENGANTVVMGGGVGPCRFGYYCEVQREVLQELNYQFDFFVIEPNIKRTIYNIHKFFGGIPLKKIYSAGKLAWKKTLVLDEINKLVLKSRAKEKENGIVDKHYESFKKKIDKAMSIEKINKLTEEYKNKINYSLSHSKRGIEIKVGIVGEIYLVLEPFINRDIAKKLGELGVNVSRKIYLSEWVYEFLNMSDEHQKVSENAFPYLRTKVGGHGIDTIGNSVRYAKNGYDGVIQLAPFTCMPEIVAQTILPEVSKNEDLPILTVFFDEHTGEAGLITRLEAFVDLLERNKRRREKLYG